MKKKGQNNIKKFPLFEGIDSKLEAQRTPEWKNEVHRKVEEHLKKKHLRKQFEMQKGKPSGGKDGISSTIPEVHPKNVKLGDVSQETKKPTQEKLSSELHPSSAHGFAPEEIQKLKKKLISDHRQFFENHDESVPIPSKTTQRVDIGEIELNQNPLPDPSIVIDDIDNAEGITPDDMPLTIEEVEKKHLAQRVKKKIPDRTILVSRFLSGLIDFIILLFFSIFFAESAAHIMKWDPFSKNVGILLLMGMFLCQLVYSFYFLYIAGRTIGMLIVGLKVQSENSARLSFSAVLIRTLCYILSIVCIFLGIIWGIFDRKVQCWHDILSDTQVVRVL